MLKLVKGSLSQSKNNGGIKAFKTEQLLVITRPQCQTYLFIMPTNSLYAGLAIYPQTNTQAHPFRQNVALSAESVSAFATSRTDGFPEVYGEEQSRVKV